MTHYGPSIIFVEQAGLEPAAPGILTAGRGDHTQLLRVTRPTMGRVFLSPSDYFPQELG